jgi:zinc/manganese transport system substrate-binding protein
MMRFTCVLMSLLLAGALHAQEMTPQEMTPQKTIPHRLKVVASFSILADLASTVGGDDVDVTSLVGVGGDAHVFQPSPRDAQKLGQADVIIVNGLGFEGWIDRLIKVSGTSAHVIIASEQIVPRRRGAGEVDAGALDPHAWQSVANAKLYVAAITHGLSFVDPQHAPVYQRRSEVFQARLDQLDRDVRAAMAALAPERRRIISTHDAFGYFGAAYGLTLIPLQGVSTEAEPSARDMAHIIAQIKAEKVPAVFLENISDPRLMRQIAQASGAHIGATLYTDSLSGPEGPAGNYEAMMRSNIKALTQSLSQAQ